MARLCLFGALSLLLACSANSQPSQRIIIGFESSLSSAQQASLQQSLEDLLGYSLQLAESSNDQRWVVVLDGAALDRRLNPDQVKNLIAKIQSLPEVRYAEPDGLMQAH